MFFKENVYISEINGLSPCPSWPDWGWGGRLTSIPALNMDPQLLICIVSITARITDKEQIEEIIF